MSSPPCGMLRSTPPRFAGASDVSSPTVGSAVQTATITAWMGEIAAAVRAERDHLTQLDAAIGDGDHGINMNRGFDAVTKALAVEENGTSPRSLRVIVRKTLVSTLVAASCPHWGTAFRQAGRSLGDVPE